MVRKAWVSGSSYPRESRASRLSLLMYPPVRLVVGIGLLVDRLGENVGHDKHQDCKSDIQCHCATVLVLVLHW